MPWCEVQHKPGDGECVGCYLDVAAECSVNRGVPVATEQADSLNGDPHE